MKNWIFVLLVMAMPLLADEFTSYEWEVTFRQAADAYQAQLHIEYEFTGSATEHPEVLALPNDRNLNLLSLKFKVDGQKVEQVEDQMKTYWSHGRPVKVFIPAAKPGSKVEAKAVYAIHNLFLIPPAPTSLPVKAKFNISFAPLPNFAMTGVFVGKTRKFSRKKIAAKPGDPSFAQISSFKNGPTEDHQELFYLIPQNYDHEINLDLEAVLNQRQAQLSASGNELKPYAAVFYKGDVKRDWRFAPTWIQMKDTILPFGIIPGGTSVNSSLFAGAGMNEDDLIPWVDPQYKVSNQFSDNMKVLQSIDQFLPSFRESLKTDPSLGNILALEEGGSISPAKANQNLATEIAKTFGAEVAVAFASRHPQDLAPHLPLSSFDRVITAIHVGDHWFFVDAADEGWNLRNARDFLKGYTIVFWGGGSLMGMTF